MRHGTLFLCCLVLAGCSSGGNPPPQPTGTATLFEGARLIVGDGSAPIENSAVLVERGTFTRVGRRGEWQPPEGTVRVDLSGKTVMPAIIDLHSHLGYTVVRTNRTAKDAYSRENLVDHLRRYAFYGIAATLSMGVDPGDLQYQLRDEPLPDAASFHTTGPGIALPGAGPGAEYRKDAPYGITTEAEARTAVQELAAKKVTMVKIWVDDRNGTVKKLPPPLYRAIIDEAHTRNLRVVAHIFNLEDAKELLRSGIDGFAHGVRDKDVDDELIGLFKQRPEVFVIPNLPDSGAMTNDEFTWLMETVPAEVVQAMKDAQAKRTPQEARTAREFYELQTRNLAKLHAAGVRIVFGTDAGISIGWNAHAELADMVAAGMTPAQVIVAATRDSAQILRLADAGMVAGGKRADFVVLDANPHDDITNTRRIAGVYLRGQAVDRASLRTAFAGPSR